MHGKKQIAARISAVCGATSLLESFSGKPSLIILNYHRVGNAEQTPYDSGVFSCTTAEFEWQVTYLKRHFCLVDLPQALDFVHGRTTLSEPSILLTFDDGYLDNHSEAFPVLRRQGVSATFFLPTAFVGTGRLPWWDVIAFLLKHSPRSSISLTYPRAAVFDLSAASRATSIAAVLRLFKHGGVTDTERFLSELEAACGCDSPRDSERCFLSWDEAREMQAHGMCFGSHTHTHEILARLPYKQQLEELTVSCAILERELGTPISTLAYPVGQADTFSHETFEALRAASYTTAFSFKGGINTAAQPFDVARQGVHGEARNIFRLRLASLAAFQRSPV